MANCKLPQELAPIFGSKTRPTQNVSLDSLKDVGVNFETYTLQKGDILSFPTLDEMKFKSQPVREGNKNLVYLAACMRRHAGEPVESAKPTWFNLNSLTKRDVDNNPVHEEIYNLGNMKARVEWLAKVGSITATETKTITVPAFNQDGTRKYEDSIDPDTQESIQIPVNKEQEVAIIVAYKGE